MKPPKLKNKSAVTGKYVPAKTAKASPATTFTSDDYPARMLRKMVRLWESDDVDDILEIDKLIANIKRRMKWK